MRASLALPPGISHYFRSRSTNPDISFRERTIRVASVVMLVVVLLAIFASIVVFGEREWPLRSYKTVFAIMGVMLIGVLITLDRGNVVFAGALLYAGFLEVMAGILIIEGYWAFLNLPVLMLALLIGAMALPRRAVWLAGGFGYVVLVIATLFQVSLSLNSPSNLPPLFTPESFLVNCFFTCFTELVGLSSMLTEAASRLSALNSANIEKEEANRQRIIAMQQAVEESDKANKLKSQFLANMSHELRTPLNAIIGYTDIMLAGMVGTFTEKQTELQTHIQTNAKRLLTLINDILDLAKIESGTIELFLTLASPRKVVTDTVTTLQSLAQKKSITLHAEIDETAPEAVLCDVTKVQQVITNLVGNAVKFTQTGGVTVHVSSQERGTWAIKVQDTGRGMPPEALNYIFETFRQVDASDSKDQQGTGLGLAITKRLVDRLGGNITVTTELGVGSTFTVTLPRLAPEAHQAQSANEPK